jgi:hypothetical protein
METNTKYTEFFEDVVELLAQSQNKIAKVKEIISDTQLVKKPTKKVLLGHIDTIFGDINSIADKLALLGKVK